MDSCYWRLVYADDSVIDEPLTNGTILDSRPGALVLLLCRATVLEQHDVREPFCRIDLFEANDARPYSPIFYRKRSMALDGGGRRLDLTVFGRGRAAMGGSRALRGGLEVDIGFDGTLYAYNGERVLDCPQWAMDQAAVANLLQAAIR